MLFAAVHESAIGYLDRVVGDYRLRKRKHPT
jgi:hypothetical protein